MTEYEGVIEKFIGDAVMAFFGVPKVHEITGKGYSAAKEIHEIVNAISPRIEQNLEGRSRCIPALILVS